jgi:hypothetical protein
MKAQSDFQYQTNSAEEQAGIRGLLLQQRGFNQDADLSMRGLALQNQLTEKELKNNADIASRQRQAESEANTLNNWAKAIGVGSKFII